MMTDGAREFWAIALFPLMAFGYCGFIMICIWIFGDKKDDQS